MARPLRIEYENAWYHVMNYDIFLHSLGECVFKYAIEIHAYCLMNNHYHLLEKTPYANLSRAMRQIDGVYTPLQSFGKSRRFFISWEIPLSMIVKTTACAFGKIPRTYLDERGRRTILQEQQQCI